MSRLDDSTIDEIARLLCGDDGPLYRKGWELQNFLSRQESRTSLSMTATTSAMDK